MNHNNIKAVAEQLKKAKQEFSISLIGYSYFITVGKVTVKNADGDELPIAAGMNNYIEIMADGSMRMRILLTSIPGKSVVNIATVYPILEAFKTTYKQIIGSLESVFVEAYKYTQLQVIKQFTPEYVFSEPVDNAFGNALRKYLPDHRSHYGDNRVINGNRFPVNDYLIVDRHFMDTYNIQYNNENLINLLFECEYLNMGYIDELMIPPSMEQSN